LNVDLLEPEAIERYDAVDAAIARSTDALEIRAAGAVPILDRLVNNAYKLDLKGNSRRREKIATQS
jgi:hypothetical protein